MSWQTYLKWRMRSEKQRRAHRRKFPTTYKGLEEYIREYERVLSNKPRVRYKLRTVYTTLCDGLIIRQWC